MNGALSELSRTLAERTHLDIALRLAEVHGRFQGAIGAMAVLLFLAGLLVW